MCSPCSTAQLQTLKDYEGRARRGLGEDADIRDGAAYGGRITQRIGDGWQNDGIFSRCQAPRQCHVKAPFGKDVRIAPECQEFALARAKFIRFAARNLGLGRGRTMRIKRRDSTICKHLQGRAGLGLTQREEAIQIGDLKRRQGKGCGARGEILRGLKRRLCVTLNAKGWLQRCVKPIAARFGGDLRDINPSNGWLG